MKKHLQDHLRKQNKLRTKAALPIVRKEKPAAAKAEKPKADAPTQAKRKEGDA